jgi:gluconolactonase
MVSPVGLLAQDQPPLVPDGVVYVIKSGDTLGGLASLWLNSADKAEDIKKATLAAAKLGLEGLAQESTFEALVEGQKLILPVPLTEKDPSKFIIDQKLNFPEAPFWSTKDEALYYVEWGGDKIWKLKNGQKSLFLANPEGDGPCGIDQDKDGNLWVALYTSGHLALYAPDGTELKRYREGPNGPFVGPNDLVIDSDGGVYFTDSGNFEEDWTSGREAGKLYYLNSQGQILLLDDSISYANGVTLSPDGKTLYLNEHRKNQILSYPVLAPGQIGERQVFIKLDSNCLAVAEVCYEVGPDGMTRDADGNLWVAHYHSGAMLKISPQGQVTQKLFLPLGDTPTNAALSPNGQALYVSEASQGLLLLIPIK